MTFSSISSAASLSVPPIAPKADMPPPLFLPARFGNNVLAALATSVPVGQLPPGSMEMEIEDDLMDLVDEVEELEGFRGSPPKVICVGFGLFLLAGAGAGAAFADSFSSAYNIDRIFDKTRYPQEIPQAIQSGQFLT
ncbi:uncharacterized protein BX663DRAFT_561122 [Cokeromyces recurvatus]|uniref:uncharacterized protein n=1 Tax=Cokeromyces recurvatus TaxID=90255 RepID=UPI0022207A80|nr:uncharacterized protein BX663DRAFT_561122 [Cokeromyces recurvatus]KAI7903063.1 hypothetical protein BX663DRAFT_561122 [Cokeromyces recurvatus]